jgi:hypothetical protein
VKSLTDPTLLRRWLKKKLALTIVEYFLTGLFAFLGGILALMIAFGFFCLVTEAGVLCLSACSQLWLGKALHLPLYWIFILGSLFLVLLFVEHARTRWDYLGSYKLQNPGLLLGGLTDTLFSLFFNPEAAGRIIADFLFIGPRLTVWLCSTIRRSFRLMRTDLDNTTETLAILTRRLHRTSFQELSKLLSRQDPMKALLVLQELDCVLFLVKEPAGVILAPDAREELSRLTGQSADAESVPPPPPPPPPEEEPIVAESIENFEYYELLGVRPTASLAEIKAAYRNRIKQCHPDRFVDRGAEFRQLAEERAKALNEAYEILSAKREAAR